MRLSTCRRLGMRREEVDDHRRAQRDAPRHHRPAAQHALREGEQVLALGLDADALGVGRVCEAPAEDVQDQGSPAIKRLERFIPLPATPPRPSQLAFDSPLTPPIEKDAKCM